MKRNSNSYLSFLNTLSISITALMLLFFIVSPYLESILDKDNNDLIENYSDDCEEEESKEEYKANKRNFLSPNLFIVESKIIAQLKTAYLNRIIKNFPLEVELLPPEIV